MFLYVIKTSTPQRLPQNTCRVSQVLPAWTRCPPTATVAEAEALDAEQEATWQERFLDFVDLSKEDGHAAMPATMTERLANMYYCKALDHALAAGAGLSLQDYVPVRRLGPLSPTEPRYFVDDSVVHPQ